jgi:putative RecB family exonuclease
MSLDLLSRDDLAERAGGVWNYISPSRLNLWLRCRLAFRLRYIDGIETPSSPSLFIGKMVHAGLECWYRHRQLGITLDPADVAHRLIESWGQTATDERIAFESTADEQASRKQTIELVSAYLVQLPPDEPRPLAVEVAVEAPLIDPRSGEDLGIPLVGVMDLVLSDPAGPIICDFKTAARGGEPLEIVHEIQLSSYSYLFRHSTPQPESALEIRSLVKTKVPKVETHRYGPRSEAHFRRLFAVVRDYLDNLDVGRFTFRPGLHCASCDHRQTTCKTWSG